MNILMVNKFLYPKGGAETYVIKIGAYLQEKGNRVEYFGLYNKKNILKNNLNLYVKDINLQKNNLKAMYRPFRMINCKEASKKITKILLDFNPNLIILNNIEYHITPSIILAINNYRKKTGSKVKIFYVAHDYQLICPTHGLFDKNINICEKCLGGNFWNCYKTKCMKNSRTKSLLATLDSIYWRNKKVYKYVDKIICPSHFLKTKLDTQDE